jgi:hypothetical protein
MIFGNLTFRMVWIRRQLDGLLLHLITVQKRGFNALDAKQYS